MNFLQKFFIPKRRSLPGSGYTPIMNEKSTRIVTTAEKRLAAEKNDHGGPTFDLELGGKLHLHEKKSRECIAAEGIVARILKGFCQVSEQIIDGEGGYSYEHNSAEMKIKFADFKKKFPEQADNAVADGLLIFYLFNDNDHILRMSHNVKFYKNGIYSFFDFGLVHCYFWKDSSEQEIGKYLTALYSTQQEILKNKLTAIKSFYSSENGRGTLYSILNKAGPDLGKVLLDRGRRTVDQGRIHKTLLERIDSLLALL